MTTGTLFPDRGAMHYARLENSPRQQRTLAVLLDGNRHSTMDLIQQAQVCAVNSIMAELRRNGVTYHCQQMGHSEWQYWIPTECLATAREALRAAQTAMGEQIGAQVQ